MPEFTFWNISGMSAWMSDKQFTSVKLYIFSYPSCSVCSKEPSHGDIPFKYLQRYVLVEK